MSFPFEPTQLRAQLRAFNWATGEIDSGTTNIVKPLKRGFFHEQSNDKYLKNLRAESPPIPYELPIDPTHHTAIPLGHRKGLSTKSLPKPLKGEKRSQKQSKTDKKSRRTKSTATRASNDTIEEGFTYNKAPSAISMDQKVSSESNAPKLRLTKLFKKPERSRSSGSYSDGSIEDRVSLPSVGSVARLISTVSSITNKSLDVGDTLSSLSISYPGKDTSNSGLEKSKSSGVDTSSTGISLYDNDNDNNEDDDDDGDDYEEDDDDDERDENADETLDEDESFQTISSAFTEMKSDSLDSGSLIYDYTVPDSYVLQDQELARLRNGVEDRLDSAPFGKPTKEATLSSLLSSTGEGYAKAHSKSEVGTPRQRRQTSFSFQKMYSKIPSTGDENYSSNLSSLIQSRHKSSNNNPLNYYSYINSDTTTTGTKIVKVDIFVPPKMKPEIEQMEISSGASIVDCIGFILLKLSSGPGAEKLDIKAMNPNTWRIELIDEDGELYDSTFGVLDRTRLLSSYNCPNCLALCKVTNDAEIARNEKQTPLPLELRQNLIQYHAKESSAQIEVTKSATENLPDEINKKSIEVKVGNIPGTSPGTYVSFYTSSTMKVVGLLDLIGETYHFDSTSYLLCMREGQRAKPTILAEDPDKETWVVILDNTICLDDLSTNIFWLVLKTSNERKNLKNANINSVLESGITPSSVAFTPTTITSSGITPPARQLEGKFQKLAIELDNKNNNESNGAKTETFTTKTNSTAEPTDFQFNFGDLLHGKGRNQLPATLNTIYFKWKVYRKKSPILNRIEKSLIIDGDHIHLAPSDDMKWRKNPYDNPFSSSNNNSNSNHHHHYLHHYNYSKYYNDTIMKTSSFHITQIVKIKQYKQSKNPNHFKIVIQKASDTGGKETTIKKKYDLEAESVAECEEIIEKITWALQVYKLSSLA